MQASELKKKYQEYLQTLIEEIKNQKSSDLILDYLDFCSRFHRYSFNNQMLIWSVMPEATKVGGFHLWKKLGRSVKKGEKGIPIFAPIIAKRKSKSEDKEGITEGITGGITEEDENTYNKENRIFFKVVYVWDVAQTEGKPLPETPDGMSVIGSAEHILPLLEKYTLSEKIELNYTENLGGAHGMSRMGQIVLLSSLSDEQKFHTLAHELAHEHLHKIKERRTFSKKLKETEAEAVAYIVSRHFGLTLTSSTYLATYQTEEVDILDSFDRIVKTASRILRGIENVPSTTKKAA